MFHNIVKHSRKKAYMLVAHENGIELAHLLVIRRRAWWFPLGIHSRYSVYGEGVYAPGCNKEEIFAMFLDKIISFAGISYTRIDIRKLNDARFAYKALSERNFCPHRTIRIYNSLHSRTPEERLSKRFRKYIKKAIERGVTFSIATSQEEIKEGLKLLKYYYMSKMRKHFPPEKVLLSMFGNNSEELSGRAKMYIVRYKEKIIGCSICLYEEQCAKLLYSCGLRKSHALAHPGVLAVWAAIKDAQRLMCEHFEFLEAKIDYIRPDYMNFMLNFGGKQVSTLRWRRYRFNWINKILRAIYV